MPNPDDPLWQEINNLQIGEAGALLSFSARLAGENDWPQSYADRIIREYRRFLYLSTQADHAVTPSDQVDQAWHLHLAYTQSYWDDLCGAILKRPLHHNPTEGGSEQQAHFVNQYERTLGSYHQIFNEKPPSDIWPPAQQRFSRKYRRVDLANHWVIPRWKISRQSALLLMGILVLLAFTNHFFGGSSFATAVFGAVALLVVIFPKTSEPDEPKSWFSLFVSQDVEVTSSRDSGCGGGGCGGGD